MLVGLRLNDEPYYTVVDRRRTKELVAEAARGVSGEVREGTAAKLGRQIGAEGVFLGRVNDYSVDRSSYTAKQSHCARYSSSGNKCRNTTWVEVPCTRTTATVRVAPRLVDVESGRVVYSAEKSGTASTSYCRGEGPDTADEQLAVQARDAAVEQILADIAPHPVTVSMPIKTTLAQADQRYAEQFAGAAKFAQSGRMDRACEIWQGLAAGGAEDLALAYNLGTCAEVRGEADEASAFYAKADKMATKPDSDINRALERIRHAAAALRQTM